MKRFIGFQLNGTFSPPVLAFALALVLFIGSSFFINPGGGMASILNRGQNILHIASFLGIIAAGQTLVILSGGEGIDLSAGTTVTLGAIISAVICDKSDQLVVLALLASLCVGGLAGLLNGIGVSVLRIHPVVMTLSVSGVTMGSILAIYQGSVKGGAGPMFIRFVSFPVELGRLNLGLTGAILTWLLVSGLVWFILNRTTYGKNLYAVGVNRHAAHLSGVHVNRTVVLAYVLSGMFAAFGGFMVLAYIQTVYFIVGDAYLFPTIAAVALGGTTLAGGEGSYWGTMSGALVLTVVDSILTSIQIEQYIRQIILGTILLAVISAYGREKSLRQ